MSKSNNSDMNTDIAALRADIANLSNKVDGLSSVISEDKLTAMIATIITAQTQSSADRIITAVNAVVSAKSRTTKAVKTAKVDSDGCADDDEKEKKVAKLTHANFPKVPQSSWSSYSLYFLQMHKHYPAHIKTIVPKEALEIAAADKTVKEQIAQNATEHKKSTAFAKALWAIEKTNPELFKKTVKCLEDSLCEENAIRKKGSFSHVSKEPITDEEKSAVSN